MWTIIRLALASALIGLTAGAADARPPVWVVHGPHATVVLFGSVHLLPAGLDWEPERVRTGAAQLGALADEAWAAQVRLGTCVETELMGPRWRGPGAAAASRST